MTFSLTFDTSGWSAGLPALAESLNRGYLPQMREAKADISRSVALNFKNEGRPDKWNPLSAVTIARRRMLKKPPVAGLSTPLRVTDTLRRAAEGQPGSKSLVSVGEFGTSIELQVSYGPFQDEGTAKIPARSFFFLQDNDDDLIASRVFGEMGRRIDRVWGATSAAHGLGGGS